MTKIKDIKGLLPEKQEIIPERWQENEEGKGYNRAVDFIAEKEIEIDVERLANLMIDYDKAGVTLPIGTKVAKAIAKEFPVRVKT